MLNRNEGRIKGRIKERCVRACEESTDPPEQEQAVLRAEGSTVGSVGARRIRTEGRGREERASERGGGAFLEHIRLYSKQ